MPDARTAKRWLAAAAKTLAPRLFWRRRYGILQRLGDSRPDVQLARSLCDPNRVSVDIGADVGEFTIAMLTASRSVIAFEPRPAQARELATMFAAVGAPVRLEAVALSDEPGVTAMRVLGSDPGRSTVEVPVQRLDDLKLDDVGLVKVDAEGHELAVLRGATDTLTRNRPAILVEAEERHHPNAVAEITKLLAGLNFTGYFPVGDERRPIAEFDAAVHQNPGNIAGADEGWTTRGVYVNNFVFLPNAR
ncbi:methyltransferase [Mycobacterium intermedium]|uniref:Methyltransferase n=1 Tax=Mycobacterium intermedium TaxID=28445 RepID=A0A1E3SH61_MYCIE|nr:FkbM family methyltransferase [Mycobacterium intermedium]MCV6963259.1 FkbM family methyltransferase [Mycobacterium intermedium]ODR01480.1 methyltransferase [Mycobacterium intermedium]OPE47333.1 methyltransferase [Mycobacterium intermedium]ORB01221.1 methyltransferase [Mycobacterium intermedium]